MKKDVLFFLQENTLEFRKSVMRFLINNYIRVVAVYGDTAIEILANPEQVQVLKSSNYYALIFEQAVSATEMDRLPEDMKQISSIWNYSQEKFAQLTGSAEEKRVTWNSMGHEAPLPCSEISKDYFTEILNDNGLGSLMTENVYEPRDSQNLLSIERRLRESFSDSTRIYQLARLIYVNPDLEEIVYALPEEIVDQLFSVKKALSSKNKPGFQGFGETCWRMLGEISVGIVFAESSQNGEPIFTQGDRILLQFEIVAGLNWLARQNLTDEVYFVYDFQFTLLDMSNANEIFWLPRAVQSIRYRGNQYPGGWTGIYQYREDLRSSNGSTHGFVIFVTPFDVGHFAYEVNKTVFIADKDNYGNWGIEGVSEIVAHESCHVFGAADEYADGCSDCFSRHGCDQIPNSNCADCIQPSPLDCIMLANSKDVCVHTIRQIGWRLPLTFTPRVLNFGSVRIGDTRLLGLRAKNRTTDDITLQFPGSRNNPVFKWDAFDGTLAPGEERSFSFSFRPVANQIERAVFTATTSATGHRQYIGMGGKGPGGF